VFEGYCEDQWIFSLEASKAVGVGVGEVYNVYTLTSELDNLIYQTLYQVHIANLTPMIEFANMYSYE